MFSSCRSSVGCQVAIQSCDATLPHLQFYSGLTATLVVADIISPFVDIGLTFGIVGYGIALYAVMKGREGLRILARALRLGGKANDKDE